MHQRYGRHGPRAWLRQRMRRYARPFSPSVPIEPSPVVSSSVASTTIVRVFIPAATERMIIIVQNAMNPEDENEFVESQSDFSLVPLPQNTDAMRKLPSSPIENKARSQARIDAGEIEGLAEDGNFIRIHWNKVKRENEIFAGKAISEVYPGKEAPDEHKFDRLIKDYQRTYRQTLEGQLEKLYKEGASVDYFETGLEAQLRALAIKDRESAPQPQQRPYHQRDLAVIRVLVLLEVSLDIAEDRLADIHTWADKYESYYRNPRKEMNWPACRSFRDR